MPDLNYNNEKVREEIKNAAKKWLSLGVDGFRLDAAMHIYGDHEFKQQKDQLASNLQWWNEFALFCESINPEVYLVGEAWQDEQVLAEYAQPFDTKFNFTFAQDMMNAIINETTQETSTGKELAASIYLTLPGNPFIYYGEEIGMYGEKPDENIREPFKWSTDGSDMDTTWEEASSNKDTPSLLELKLDSSNNIHHHYKELISFRKKHQVLADGIFQAIDIGKDTILAYKRSNEEEQLIVFHNLSKEAVEIQNELLTKGKILYDSSLENKVGNEMETATIVLEPYSTVIVGNSTER